MLTGPRNPLDSCHRHSHHPRHPKGKQKNSLITWTHTSLEHAIPPLNHHHDDCRQSSSSRFSKSRCRSSQLNGTGLQFQCPPGDQATRPRLGCASSSLTTPEKSTSGSPMGVTTVARPAERHGEARRGGSFRVAASVGLRPQRRGVRSNHGLTLQSFQLQSLSWIANLPWRCRR